MINKEIVKVLEHKGKEFEIDTAQALLIETLKDLINSLNKLARKI